MWKLNREQTIALGVLVLVLILSVVVPIWSLEERSGALQERADGHVLLDRLEAAVQRSGGGRSGTQAHRIAKAPDAAFLNAATSGLASAQFEAYLSQVLHKTQANLISSSVKPADRDDTPDILRVQINLEVPYEALQGLLYKLETGAPYVFIDAMDLQPVNARDARAQAMKVTLGLHAIWRRPSI